MVEDPMSGRVSFNAWPNSSFGTYSSYSQGSLEKTLWVKLSCPYLAAAVKQLLHCALRVVKFLLKTEWESQSRKGAIRKNNADKERGSRDAVRVCGSEPSKADVHYTLGRQQWPWLFLESRIFFSLVDVIWDSMEPYDS